MASFRFLAATSGNETREGIIEAEGVQEALQVLRGRGLFVIRIGRPSRIASLWALLNKDMTLRRPVGAAELARLSQEWAGFVEAGIRVDESLALLGHSGRPSVQQVISGVRESLKTGMALHEALGQFPGSFPPVYRALVRAGETAGNLGPTLRRLGDDLIVRRALAEDVRNALLYPLFLMATAGIGILVLLLVVVPNLETLMGEGGEDGLPGTTRLVLAVSHILRDDGTALLGGSAILTVAAILVILRPGGRLRLDAVVLKLPVLGSLVRVIETGRFARTLGALLGGGVAVSTAMPVALQTVVNRRMRGGLESAHRAVVSGAAIGDALAASNVLLEDSIGLIRVGERTGRLADALERTATLHEARATRELKALTAMLTPLMTLGFGAVAGVIVYAMLSVILSINEVASQ